MLVLLVSHIRLSCTFNVKKSYARSEGKELGRKSEKKLSQIGNTDSHNDTIVSLCYLRLLTEKYGGRFKDRFNYLLANLHFLYQCILLIKQPLQSAA